MTTTLDLIQHSGSKLRDIIIPILDSQYPMVGELEREYIFRKITGSVESWYLFMSKYVVPIREHIELNVANGKPKYPMDLPPIVPGMTFRSVDPEVFLKLNKMMVFYLNLYDWLENEQQPKSGTDKP